MDKKTVIALCDWFYHNQRNQQKLPWRQLGGAQSAWWVLVSEMMLQQTMVASIAKRFPIFIKKFPSPDAMVAGGIDKVLDAWAGLGYYRRAHYLFLSAQKISSDGWQKNIDTLKTLPGVGDYTAKALLAFAFLQKTIPLDGNMIRVLSRFLKKNFYLAKTPLAKKYLASLPDRLLPDKNLPPSFIISDWVQAMMDLAHEICLPQKPLCSICPLQKKCLGQKHWRYYPRLKKKPIRQKVYGAVLICQNHKGEYLLQRRFYQKTNLPKFSLNGAQGLYQGLLSFPLSSLVTRRKNASWNFANIIDDKKSTYDKIKPDRVVRDLTHRRLVLSLVFCHISKLSSYGGNDKIIWVHGDELLHLPLPAVMKKVVREIV
ncbi:MAG: hypothetical protein ACR2NY_04575 [Alphaproteobacteria bacterium]